MFRGYLIVFILLFAGCQSNVEDVGELPNEQGRKNESYVYTLMHQYRAPNERFDGNKPPPPIGISYLTVGAIYKGDTLRVLLNTVSELVSINEIAGLPTDSVSIAALIKGDTFLELNGEVIKEVYIIKPSISIDSIKVQGKEYLFDYYFKESGYQKVQLSFQEQANLIDALSDWGLLISRDDYIGSYHMNVPSID